MNATSAAANYTVDTAVQNAIMDGDIDGFINAYLKMQANKD